MDKQEIEFISAINLEDYKKNSLIIVRTDLNKPAADLDNLRRTLSDLKTKLDLDDSTTLWVVGQDTEMKAFDENDMNSMGWFKK